jgi:Kef-type K+ transport system membrane component KefB
MSLGRVIRWVLVLAIIGWVAYSAAGAAWSYFSAQEVVEKALRDASERHRVAFAMGTQAAVDSLTSTVRVAILLGAIHEGLLIEEKDVTVSANSAGFVASARWSYPVVSYEKWNILVVPLSVHRSVVLAP